MADTWRENAIVQAIQIIADKKISQAGYDKTIKGIINKVIDEVAGKYEVRYQDSLFEAYATSAKIKYEKDQQVSVLVPGNDWDRTKTILSGVNNVATNYQQVPVVGQQYNNIGPSGTSINNIVELSSYADDVTIDITDKVNINDISNYIKKGDSLALGMTVRTAFADSQFGGKYGLIFNIAYKDNVTGKQVIRQFQVDQSDVIGHPYRLTSPTNVETLIKNADTSNFIRVDSIQAFCNGFPTDSSKEEIKDIFISDIRVNGAKALTDDELKGYVLHIDDSAKGNTLGNGISQIPLVAVLKVNGKPTTQNVVYYWFRQNGTVFRGHDRYSGYAGDGWECLNYKDGSGFVPKDKGNFNFNTKKDILGQMSDSDKENPEIKDLAVPTALVPQKVMKVLCVAVYNNQDWITGQIEVINNNISNQIKIISSDLVEDEKNQTVYYFNNGHPTLTCNSGLNGGGITYQWSVKPSRGGAVQKPETTSLNIQYANYKSVYDTQVAKANNMAQNSKESYIKNDDIYKNAVNNWNEIKNVERIEGNQYINFPISSISDYSIISCAVTQNDQYKGTASITLYNKLQLEGMYSLNIENGTQVFQYDGKGNSPASPQVEKPLQIQPLRFTLIDNQGTEITHDQIRAQGWIKWIIPTTQTLLISNQEDGVSGSLDLTVSRADLPLSADKYLVYSGLDTFDYSIEDRYDSKDNINYIWLNIKYKDVILDAYTDFTFPKDGDPGTNGTDYVAKITPSNDTDRVYISDREQTKMFDDNGATVDNLKFQLYNNSRLVGNTANYWTCPPYTQSTVGSDTKRNGTTYLAQNSNWTKPKLNVSNKSLQDIRDEKPVNIIRGQYGTGSEQGNLKYFAEYPICTEFVKNGFRLKIKPKTGFKYVVYSEDGTRPDYDNTLPFEIIVQKANGSYWEIDNTSRTYTWYAIGNITPKEITGKTAAFKPVDTFDGSDLSSAIVCEVSGVGRIHVPIYMILNRYGHTALNGWDGNSIQLNANGDTILAPQIGAGKKQSDDNTFTGILMGDVKTANSTDTGIMGYDHGARSIFLDAKTGNATFGKSGAAQIKITASSEQGTIQSGDYNYNTSNHNGKGLKIKFSSTGSGSEQGPYIRYGSNKFSVSADGSIHAAGSGDIAGWNITDTKLHKDNKVGMASSNETVPTDIGLKNGDNDTTAFWAGGTLNTSGTNNGKLKSANFYVTHGGYLYSKLGRIAKWNINENTLQHTDGKVGMGTGSSKTFHYTDSSNNSTSVSITNPRFWAINGSKQCIIDNNGKLWANEARIGPWLVDQSKLSNGYTGLGSNLISSTDMNNAFGSGTTSNGIQARIWASTANTNKSVNFVVSNDGKLYSKAGKIGGWNIEKDKLWSINKDSGEGIRLNSNGSMTGGATGTDWAIAKDGTATFKKLIANKQGFIAGWKITSNALKGGNDGKGGTTMNINSEGSMSGPGWSITSNGNATFNYINGKIANATTGGTASLTSGNYSSGGTGYTLNSDGTFGFNGGGTSIGYNGKTLDIGPWSINSNGIYYKTDDRIHIYPTGISLVTGNDITNITGSSVISEAIQAKDHFSLKSAIGKTGVITFTDGSAIHVTGGIITYVKGGEDAIYIGN